MNYTYKNITEDDLIFLHTLFQEPKYQEIFFESLSTYESWVNRYEEIKTFQIVYHFDEKIGVINTKKEDDTLTILLIALKHNLLEKGYGKRIFDDIMHSHPNLRYLVSVKDTNKRAIAYYISLGFIRMSEHIEDCGDNGKHLYIDFEKLILQPFKEAYREDLLSITVPESSKNFVSTPANILYKHIKYKDSTKLYLFYINNECIGTVLTRLNRSYNSIFIWHLLIDEQHQNKQFGTKIMTYFLKVVKQQSPKFAIVTTTKTENALARHFFEKLGFTVHSIEEDINEVNYVWSQI